MPARLAPVMRLIEVIRTVVTDLAREVDQTLTTWIERNVDFKSQVGDATGAKSVQTANPILPLAASSPFAAR